METLTPENLRKMRILVGLSQKKLAQLSGLSQALISRIEKGSVDPRLSTIKKIINAIEGQKGKRREIAVSEIAHKPVILITETDTVRKAVNLMEKYGISQLPVVNRRGEIVGSIQEMTIMHAIIQAKTPEDKIFSMKVKEEMEDAFPIVCPETSINEIASLLLHGHSAVLIMKRGKVAGIITKIDLIRAFCSK
jgi:predicted transcriptional regulator